MTLDPERLWRESYSKACRKNVNRAEREGVTVRAARDADDIAEFHRIYIQTMERNEALDSYFFDLAHFEAIFEELPAGARFALAEHDGRVVAATLYLHDADDVYSYLGGADHDFQQLRPTNAVVHDTIAWARAEGKRRLILGGGYRPDDGIFRFKASFSPLRATLELARRVHLPDDYEALVAAWRAHNPAGGRRRRVLPALPGDAGVSDQQDFFREVELEYWTEAEGLKDEEIALVDRYLDPSLPTLDAGTGGGRIPRALRAPRVRAR